MQANVGAVLRLSDAQSYYILGIIIASTTSLYSVYHLHGSLLANHETVYASVIFAYLAPGIRWIFWTDPFEKYQLYLHYWQKNHTANILQEIATVPHVALAAGLVAITLSHIIRGIQTHKAKHFIYGGFTLAFLTSFHPFEWVPISFTVIVVVFSLQAGRVGVRVVLKTNEADETAIQFPILTNKLILNICSLFLPTLLILSLISYNIGNNVYMDSIRQTMGGAPTSNILFNLTYLSPLLIVWLYGSLSIIRSSIRDVESQIAILVLETWTIGVLTLEHLPLVPVPSHYYEGISIVLATLSTYYTSKIFKTREIYLKVIIIVCTIISFPTLYIYFSDIVKQIRLNSIDYFLTESDLATINYFNNHVPKSSIVIANQEYILRYISAMTQSLSVVSHNAMTFKSQEKRADIAKFFEPSSSLDDRKSLISKYRINYVILRRDRDGFGCEDMEYMRIYNTDINEICVVP